MEIDFKTQKKITLVGQKVDATSCTVVSATSVNDIAVPFGALLVYDDSDKNLCKIPTTKPHLEKPLGIALRDFYGQNYPSKTPIKILRQGRVWVLCQDDVLPSDSVYLVLSADGARFTNKAAEGAIKLKGAIYLEKPQNDLAPIELNFLGGAL